MASIRQIIVLRDAAELAAAAAKMIMQAATEAITQRGRFVIALSGGSTPAAAYQIIHDHYYNQTDWAKWYIFLGDERAVPMTDPQSNMGMAKRTLLHGLPIPEAQIFAVQTQLSVVAAAAAYDQQIRKLFGTAEPRMDLILLGLGDDGHTASLFPGLPARHEKIKLVTFSPPGTLPPPLDRITFTFPLINLARQVIFLMAGEKKKNVVARLLAADVDPDVIPAANVRPMDGKLIYMMDQASAGNINSIL